MRCGTHRLDTSRHPSSVRLRRRRLRRMGLYEADCGLPARDRAGPRAVVRVVSRTATARRFAGSPGIDSAIREASSAAQAAFAAGDLLEPPLRTRPKLPAVARRARPSPRPAWI